MKNLFKSMWAVAVAAMAFTSCSKDETFDAATEPEQVTINITAGNATRTHLDGTEQVKWDATGEQLQVLENATKLSNATTEANPTISADGLTAQFKVTFAANNTATSFDYYAIYPAVNYIKDNNTLTKFKMELPKEQTPVAGSFDPKADLLISKKVTSPTQPTDLTFNFRRPITIVQLQLMGITAGETITSVVFENTTAALTGRLFYDFSTNTVTEYGYQGQGFKMVSLSCNQVAKGTDDVYFTSFPAELTDFTITVSTDKATYTKELKNINLSFKAGHKANVRVKDLNLTREEKVVDTYTLVTSDNVKQLKEGYKLIITNGNTGSVVAMGAKVSGENRMGLSSTITVAGSVINSIPTDAQILTIEGDTTVGFLLNSEYGYLSLNGTANELKHIAAAKDASKWKISIDKTNGNTDIISGTRPIRFNTTYFASYKGITSCKPVYAFFKAGVAKTALATPTNLTATVAEGTNSAVVTWDAVANADNYTVTCGTYSRDVTTTTATIENLDWESTVNIEVVANPKAGDETYKSSVAATTTATVGKNPAAGKGSIKELRTLMQSTTYDVKSYCGGSVDAYIAAVYSGKVAVVDNTGEAGSGLTLYQATLPTGVQVGQEVTLDLLNATRSEYNGLLQIKTAKVTIKNATPTTIVKPTITANEFNTGNYQGMYVSINATTPAPASTWGSNPVMKGSDGVSFNTHVPSELSGARFSANTTGVISGIGDCFKTGQQIAPQTAEDIKDFADMTPDFTVSASFEMMDSETAPATGTITLTNVYNPQNLSIEATIGTGYTASVAGNTITIKADATTTTNKTATLTVKIGSITKSVTITHKPYAVVSKTTISLDFSKDLPADFPTSYVKVRTKYSFQNYDFFIYGGNGFKKQGNNAILFGKTGAYIEFPVIAGKKLTKVVAKPASGASAKVSLNITDTSDKAVDATLNQVWKDKTITYTYDLAGKTVVETAYRLEVTNSNNAQVTTLELTYE